MINSRTYRTYHFHISSGRPAEKPSSLFTKYRQAAAQAAKQHWLQFSLHVCTWALLYFLPLVMRVAGNAVMQYYPAGNIIHLLSFGLLISFSYLNYYWLVPELYMKKAAAPWFLLAAVFFAAIAGAEILIIPRDGIPVMSPETGFFLSGLSYSVLLFIISLSLSIIIHLHAARNAAAKEVMKMKRSLLNAQVKPHFLFNSLHWIHGLAAGKSAETPNAILQLSGMMRYILKETVSDFIELKKELAYIKNYTALQQGRLGDTVSINCSVADYTGNGKIAPLLLMPVIENAFLYGVSPAEDSAIYIHIFANGNRLYAQVINNKLTGTTYAGTINNSPGGIQQRLQLLYPGAHQLEILEDKKIYSVKLSIDII